MIRKIPADTSSYHFYNANPEGIRAGDCVVRAIATATSTPWITTYRGLVEVGISMYRVATEKETYSEYLRQIGWIKRPCPKKGETNCRYSGKEFSKLLRSNGVQYPILAHIGAHHLVCFWAGIVYDIWDSSGGAVGSVWVHPLCLEQFRQIEAQY